MLIIKLIRISFIFFLFNNFSILKADIKESIIENINNSESLKFDFVQIANEKKETGICFLKRPYYLKCEYNDKNKKELIVNRKRLVMLDFRKGTNHFLFYNWQFWFKRLGFNKFR